MSRPRLMRTQLMTSNEVVAMFEDSVICVSAPARNGAVRVASLVSIIAQAGLAAVLCTLPLLHPQGLTVRSPAAPLFVPTLRRQPPTKPVRVNAVMPDADRSETLPTLRAEAPRIPSRVAEAVSDLPPSAATPMFGPGGPPAGVLTTGGPGTTVSIGNGTVRDGAGAVSNRKRPVRVSSGVSAGLLLSPIRPTYPQIARETRTEGTVAVQARITRDGAVSEVHAIAGPVLLRQAAVDAVRSARYRPFRLNGEPMEVEAVFSIVFHIGAG